MTFYATFDHTVDDPTPVTGWIDTVRAPGALPDFQDLLELTQDQWDGRLISAWAIVAGVLTVYVPPIPLPVQAQAALATMIAQGITITSVSTSAVNGVYALDGVSTSQIFQLGTFANSFGVFPSGSSTQPYPDINSAVHMFSVTVFIAFLRAVAALISNLQTQTGIMSQGGTPSWPSMSTSII
jgi:hypothetical protein